MADPCDPPVVHRHSPAFERLVEETRARVSELTIEQYRERLAAGEPLVLVDVREDLEWAASRIPGAVHLGRGILERDVEKHFPDKDAPLVLQCGGGFRSVLAADNLQRMGYTRVTSLAEGLRGWIARGLPLEEGR